MFTFVMQNDGLNNHANFETFGGALLLLFQVLTGDSWSGVMHGAMVDADLGCEPDTVPSNCGSKLAMPYFVSYLLIGNFVFLNLVVAVVLENFSVAGAERDEQTRRRTEQLPELVTAEHVEDFRRVWCRFDCNGNQRVPRSQLPYIFASVRYPLGLAKDKPPSKLDASEAAAEAAIAEASGEGAEREVLTAVSAEAEAEAAAKLSEQLEIRRSSVSGASLSSDHERLSLQRQATGDEVHFSDVLDALLQRAFRDVLAVPDSTVVAARMEEIEVSKAERRELGGVSDSMENELNMLAT
jgi:hypothetical protein